MAMLELNNVFRTRRIGTDKMLNTYNSIRGCIFENQIERIMMKRTSHMNTPEAIPPAADSRTSTQNKVNINPHFD